MRFTTLIICVCLLAGCQDRQPTAGAASPVAQPVQAADDVVLCDRVPRRGYVDLGPSFYVKLDGEHRLLHQGQLPSVGKGLTTTRTPAFAPKNDCVTATWFDWDGPNPQQVEDWAYAKTILGEDDAIYSKSPSASFGCVKGKPATEEKRRSEACLADGNRECAQTSGARWILHDAGVDGRVCEPRKNCTISLDQMPEWVDVPRFAMGMLTLNPRQSTTIWWPDPYEVVLALLASQHFSTVEAQLTARSTDSNVDIVNREAAKQVLKMMKDGVFMDMHRQDAVWASRRHVREAVQALSRLSSQ